VTVFSKTKRADKWKVELKRSLKVRFVKCSLENPSGQSLLNPSIDIQIASRMDSMCDARHGHGKSEVIVTAPSPVAITKVRGHQP
jgi:hypothetical protein